MVTARPIIFSGPMVLAVLAGTKRQTRRIVRPQPPDWVHPEIVNRTQCQDLFQWTEPEQNPARVLRRWPADHYMRCPFGFPVSHLWVRETWRAWPLVGAGDLWRVEYQADGATRDFIVPAEWSPPKALGRQPPPWVSPLFMPRFLSRLTLKVTRVDAQRLQQISEADAMAEGISQVPFRPDDGFPVSLGYMLGADDGQTPLHTSARECFRHHWDVINGDRASWDSDPWVWPISFEVVH